MQTFTLYFHLSSSARELELEDRQSRLQQELRERMAVEGKYRSSRVTLDVYIYNAWISIKLFICVFFNLCIKMSLFKTLNIQKIFLKFLKKAFRLEGGEKVAIWYLNANKSNRNRYRINDGIYNLYWPLMFFCQHRQGALSSSVVVYWHLTEKIVLPFVYFNKPTLNTDIAQVDGNALKCAITFAR